MKHFIFVLAILLLAGCQEQQNASLGPSSLLSNLANTTLTPDDPGYVAEDARHARLIGTPGPAISLQEIDGSEINLLDVYGDRPVYLKLWATFCIPCRAQMPGFESIYQSVGDRMLVVAINAGVGDDIEKVTGFVMDEGIHMPVAIDDGSLGAWLKMQETPLSLVIGLDGRIAYAGHQDGPALHAAIEQVLDTPASGAVETAAVARLETLGAGERIPAIELARADGTLIRIGEGVAVRPRALLFTAIWCEDYLLQTEPQTAHNCQQVREQVAELAAQSGAVEWQGIVSHLWTSPEALGAYEDQTRQPVPFAVDTEGSAFRVFGIRRFPAVALIDTEGRLVRVVGPDDTDLAAAVESLAAASNQ